MQAVKHALVVKDKLKAADRLAAKLTASHHHAAHKVPPLPPSARASSPRLGWGRPACSKAPVPAVRGGTAAMPVLGAGRGLSNAPGAWNAGCGQGEEGRGQGAVGGPRHRRRQARPRPLRPPHSFFSTGRSPTPSFRAVPVPGRRVMGIKI